MTGGSALRRTLENAGGSLKDLTVLSAQNDPFRVDTPARHRDGEWLAITAERLGLGDRKIHVRGMHYMILGELKPDGTPYQNTEADWLWLSGNAMKAARWLGYIPFEQIVDQRNSAPDVIVFEPPIPSPYINVGIDVDIPDTGDLEPRIGVEGFDGVQPYKLVLIGEKSSLGEVLGPVARSYKADLYLPTGCISDTLAYQMARIGADDGRPMQVFYFSDCDPSGWNMPIEIGRKLQALTALSFHDLESEVHKVALTPDQVREYGLPYNALKESEKRAGAWKSAMGVEQTEIDALAALRPDLLRQIARDALDPFFDHTLDRRVFEAQGRWLDEAQNIIDDALDDEHLATIRVEAAAKLAEMRTQIDEINQALQVDTTGFELPEIVIPEARVNVEAQPLPLVDSRWPFAEQCRALIDSKAYRNGVVR